VFCVVSYRVANDNVTVQITRDFTGCIITQATSTMWAI